ncbi:oligosaccharide biosynthesis protein Alg14 like-domain-containing protein [Russula compacta]|nr:oligosaccharide biosynthesis protein Alg14 like-domain-containing protein [Russula compacta]
MHPLIWLPVVAIFAIIARTFVILITPRRRVPHRRSHAETCHLAVFLGSGGHSSEALSLVSALDFSRYTPRTYLVSEGDTLSEQKAVALEQLKTASASSLNSGVPIGRYQILTIPRTRRVHQSILTVPFTAPRSLLAAVFHVTLAPWLSGDSTFDVLLLNGPGTCFVLCVAAYVNRFLGLPSPKLVYVESFARVRALSLTGKLLRPIVDRFVVQWPDLLRDGGRGECHGWLV